jgi:hypothetical protein
LFVFWENLQSANLLKVLSDLYSDPKTALSVLVKSRKKAIPKNYNIKKSSKQLLCNLPQITIKILQNMTNSKDYPKHWPINYPKYHRKNHHNKNISQKINEWLWNCIL